MVRPAMMHETKCWVIKNQHENKVSVEDMMMLRWMCGETRYDKIKNNNIRKSVR